MYGIETVPPLAEFPPVLGNALASRHKNKAFRIDADSHSLAGVFARHAVMVSVKGNQAQRAGPALGKGVPVKDVFLSA